MDAGFKALSEYGFSVVALVVLAVVVWWFIRDLRAQRDRANDLADSAINAFDRLVDQLAVTPTVQPQRGRREEHK